MGPVSGFALLISRKAEILLRYPINSAYNNKKNKKQKSQNEEDPEHPDRCQMFGVSTHDGYRKPQ